MPAFYPRAVPRQPPLTPPDYLSGYSTNICGSRHASEAPYTVPSNMANQDDFVYEYPDQYRQQAPLPSRSLAYQQTSTYNVPLPSYPQAGQYLEPIAAPILPPMRIQDYTAMDDADVQYKRQQEQRARNEQQPKGEKAVGGVSAQLDYDMEQMTDFVSEMAQGMYDLFTSDICIADIDLIRSIQPGVPSPPQFRKWVSQVLCATRLPSATILLSLSYLSTRMNMLSVGGPYKASEGQIYRLLTIALVLGSKFLDDNTFQNRSWSEVSGIKVVELNGLEKEWLIAIHFDLHRHPKEPQGFSSWMAHWRNYESQTSLASSRSSHSRSQSGSVQRNRSLHEDVPFQGQLSRELELEAMRQQRQAIQECLERERPERLALEAMQQQQRIDQQALQHHQQQQRTQRRQSQQPAKLIVPEFDYTRTSQQMSHHTPTYAPYDPWYPRVTKRSPVSEPQINPPTPDYYAGQRGWVPSEGYSGRNYFGFPPISNAALPPPAVYPRPPFTPTFRDSCWNNHGHGCGCMYCTRHLPSYLMPNGYGLQTVAG